MVELYAVKCDECNVLICYAPDPEALPYIICKDCNEVFIEETTEFRKQDRSKAFTIPVKEIGKAFDVALKSIWVDYGVQSMAVASQVRRMKTKFNILLTGGHFDNEGACGCDREREWDTQSAIAEFASYEDYLAFILKWG